MNKIIQADCLDVMREMPDKSIDLVLTDPPYGLNIGQRGFIGSKTTKNIFTRMHWDGGIPAAEYFGEMLRISKNQIIFGGNYFAHLLPPSKCWLVWWKKDGLPKNTFADCELAWTSFDQPALVFNSRWSGFVKDSKEKRVAHPTQKALEVVKWCIKIFTMPGDLILDPFLGSGTTAIAAQVLSRRWIGIEREGEYVEIARARLADLQQLTAIGETR